MTYEEEITMVNYLYNQYLIDAINAEIEDLENEYEKRLDDYYEMCWLEP